MAVPLLTTYTLRLCKSPYHELLNAMLTAKSPKRFVVSATASVLFVVLFAFVQPLCDCPWYYLSLGGLALVPLCFGPRAYRIFGVLALIVALVASAWQENSRKQTKQQIQQLRGSMRKH